MSRQQIVLLGGLVLMAAFLGLLLLRNPEPPLLPTDEWHADRSDLEACAACHGPDGDVPRSANHPLGDDCMRCHGLH